jgi:hypothetical protein
MRRWLVLAELVVCALLVVLAATAAASGPPINTITVPGGFHLPLPKLTATNCTQTNGTKVTAPPAREVVGTPPPKPTGLIVTQIYSVGKTPFVSSVFTSTGTKSVGRYTTGVDLAIQWCNIEPHPSVFDWKPLDRLFAEAAPRKDDPQGKFVDLTIIPGFESPAWALRGVPKVTSSYAYGGPVRARRLPQPWNNTYLNRWFAFLAAVAGRYGDKSEFRMVEAAGPTSVSTEMTLPNWPSGRDTGLPAMLNTVTLDYSDLKMWSAWGYTEPKLIGAWDRVFGRYHRLFPNQYIGLAASPIGPPPSLPSETQLDAIAAGKYYDPKRLIVQEDGMGGGSTVNSPPYNIVQANCGSTVTGYQTKVPGKITNFNAAIRQSIDAGVDFLEVYERDVLTHPRVLARYAGSFPASSRCKPLTLTALRTWTGASRLRATTAVNLAAGETINVFQLTPAGSYVGTTCTASARAAVCALPTGSQSVTFEADIGAPGALPYTPQALVSATTTAVTEATTLTGRPGPPCEPDCL